jgi:uncharacterized protein involved in exopolysaccharide biosynthesis
MLAVLQTLLRWRKFILIAGLASALLMAGISLLLPKWYTAASSVFPPETNQFGTSSWKQTMMALQLPVLGPTASGLAPSTIYVDVLKSRRVCERIIDEFNFKEIYKAKLMDDALAVLHSHTFYSLMDNGLLTIRFEDQDPKRAAAVTNRYVELLDEFNRGLNSTRASNTKRFIAEQIQIRSDDLSEAEDSLRAFGEQNKTLHLDAQVDRSISVVSTLTADAIALEVDLEILRQYASTSSQEYIRKKKRYDEVLRQLQKFEISSTRSENDVIRAFFPTFDKVPEVTLELARRTRRVRVEEKVYQLLVEEYEKSRIEEARNTPTVSVLDIARVPEQKSRPKRAVIALAGGVAGVAWSSLFALFSTMWREDSRRSATVRGLLQPLFADLRRFRRRQRSA